MSDSLESLFLELIANEFRLQQSLREHEQPEFLAAKSEQRWSRHVAKAIPDFRKKSEKLWKDDWEHPCSVLSPRGRIDLTLGTDEVTWAIEMKCFSAGGGIRNDALRLLLATGYQQRLLLVAGPTTTKTRTVDGHRIVDMLTDQEEWRQHVCSVENGKYKGKYLLENQRVHNKWVSEHRSLPPLINATLIGEHRIGEKTAVALISIAEPTA